MPRVSLPRSVVEAPELRPLLDTLRSLDPSRRLPVGEPGLIGELYAACNDLLDQNRRLTRDLDRVRAEVARVGGITPADRVDSMVTALGAQLRALADVVVAVTEGDLTRAIPGDARGQFGALAHSIGLMIANLRDTTRKNNEQDWLKTNLARITRLLQGHRDRAQLAALVLRELTPLVRAQLGLFYLVEGGEPGDLEPPRLRLLSSWAVASEQARQVVRFGEGLVGQCALERRRILLTDVPDGYLKIGSGLGEASPRSVVVLPVAFEGELKAVVELASFHAFGDIHLAFLDQLTESIGIVLHTLAANIRTEQLLAQSQSLAEELRGQQRELTATNRRLEQQALALQASEERLRLQQEELQQTNRELEERSELLQQQNLEVERNNREIERAKLDLEERAQQLILSSKYKSEFLANMSHELRTPLNSLLILAQLLADNPEGNLEAKQVEFARTIHSAGSELLALINDILDLSKIESGTMGIDIDELMIESLRDQVERSFRPVAETRRLAFEIDVGADVPPVIYTDPRRLLQVLKNLLSNAFKFTDKGKVDLRIETVPDRQGRPGEVISFSVTDTGIGIPPHKQRIIFEAFQQADGTTSRRYGGTGLGLSISREIARLLGGEIVVRSAPGAGSTFTLLIPQTPEAVLGTATSVNLHEPEGGSDGASPVILRDDRERIVPGDRTLLIIDDDTSFARLILDLAREKGFKGLVALRGDDGLALARDVRPDAITLDLNLPGLDGWTVLDRLKHDPRTRHIPVHLISGTEVDARPRALKQGALAFLPKPVSREALAAALADVKGFVERRVRSLLIVEDDAEQREALVDLIGDDDVEATAVATAEEGLALLRERHFDCAVLDLGLPAMTGFEMIRAIRSDVRLRELPIVVHTGQTLSADEEAELGRMTEAIIVKSPQSMEHLLDETALFLHRVESELPSSRRQLAQHVDVDPVFHGKRVLVVDDDVRNIFAITSVLERHKMRVLYAEDGRRGLAILRDNPDINAVLLDVMMPEMDGYEAMKEIRKDPRFAALPIIALTAKAMRGDREKCLGAGASDYITKPVEPDRLLSLLRVWLYG
ncbi:response regulator [Nannocystis radixulma]|uniref:histidine kinase n=1 Tax=Nannocystis radixulma TaxID=2995305 RepID=A0ABT5BB75_9BACT|nr:response regulator [Nannocystis radixulma]MDC0670703.1 response regulator [Nannocystis radixulma]